MNPVRKGCSVVIAVTMLGGCTSERTHGGGGVQHENPEYYGTLEPFAANAVYFVLTDRFVDGDPGNNYPEQGGDATRRTFDRPIQLDGQAPANIGYLGGDFRGVLDNAGYIAEMGFTALWITPIVDNPDEAFTGGIAPGSGLFADRGKTGYHGYWGVDFFSVDEHLVSPGLEFGDFVRELKSFEINVVLDIVCNHGSPAYTMPFDQPKFGELYDAAGALVADHQNLHPSDLDPRNPVHAFYNRQPDLAQLADLNENNPDVLEYFLAAYMRRIDQGVAAFRIDTIKHMPHAYWKTFSDRIRGEHPGFFMFAESFSFDAAEIAEHTRPENGAISVLDFPGQQAINSVFAAGESYTELLDHLHLDSDVYRNPYELMTFYDNHDMPRMAADDLGFIDAHNWLFTSRGIPVIYYGSEMAFRAGMKEHAGNRDYFGQDNVDRAKPGRIRQALSAIANLRKQLPALQRGLQLNLAFSDDMAVFYRVFQRGDVSQTALVMLNKSDRAATVTIDRWLGPQGQVGWLDASSGFPVTRLSNGNDITVDAHGVRVLVANWIPTDPQLLADMKRQQSLFN